jgi:hypothetical protein
MKKLKKLQLAEWYVKENSDCGKIKGYFGSELTDEPVTEEFLLKWLMKKSKSEIVDMIRNYSDDGVEFLNLNGY